MRPVCSSDEIRAAEDRFFQAFPEVDLMARAAGFVTEEAAQMIGDAGRVLVVVGAGNNGGDALLAAADLANRGILVKLLITSEKVHQEALTRALENGCEPADTTDPGELLCDVDLVIDGVTGISGRPGLRPLVGALAGACDELRIPVLAVDLPSGLVADSVEASQSFRATRTITFAAEKLCHLARPAAERCGQVKVVDIGINLGHPRIQQVELHDLATRWPVPDSGSDKYSRGVVGLDTGSTRYPGAAVLSALGAVWSGAGMVRYLGPATQQVLSQTPSVVAGSGRVNSLLIGSGWGGPDDHRFSRACAANVPLVVDAEALRHLPTELPKNSLLTPHAGELAGLLEVDRGAVVADPIGSAREAAARHQAVVLLKGATQYAVRPDGEVLIAVAGPAWNAQAGSGDVLAGICAALLAAGLDAAWAAVLAASLQALIADHHPGPYPPDASIRFLPEIVAQLVS